MTTNTPIELRSDTFTKPTPNMLTAMMNAAVGDDVFGEDPSINALEQMAANMFGMEAALFCPSGTMTNQIAINVHTQPGDEVICEEGSHIYLYQKSYLQDLLKLIQNLLVLKLLKNRG